MAKHLLTAVLLLCCTAAFALSSTTNSAPFTLDTVDPAITIIAPNGGEAWFIGDTNNITWTAEDTNLTPKPTNCIISKSSEEYHEIRYVTIFAPDHFVN